MLFKFLLSCKFSIALVQNFRGEVVFQGEASRFKGAPLSARKLVFCKKAASGTSVICS